MQDNDESKGANKDQNVAIGGLLFRCEIWSPSFKDEHSGKQLTCSVLVTAASCSEVFRMFDSVTVGVQRLLVRVTRLGTFIYEKKLSAGTVEAG